MTLPECESNRMHSASSPTERALVRHWSLPPTNFGKTGSAHPSFSRGAPLPGAETKSRAASPRRRTEEAPSCGRPPVGRGRLTWGCLGWARGIRHLVVLFSPGWARSTDNACPRRPSGRITQVIGVTDAGREAEYHPECCVSRRCHRLEEPRLACFRATRVEVLQILSASSNLAMRNAWLWVTTGTHSTHPEGCCPLASAG